MIVFLFSQRTVSQRSNFEIERFDQSYFEIPFERIKWIIWNWAFFFWTTVFSGQIFKLYRIWKTFLRKRKKEKSWLSFFCKKKYLLTCRFSPSGPFKIISYVCASFTGSHDNEISVTVKIIFFFSIFGGLGLAERIWNIK